MEKESLNVFDKKWFFRNRGQVLEKYVKIFTFSKTAVSRAHNFIKNDHLNRYFPKILNINSRKFILNSRFIEQFSMTASKTYFHVQYYNLVFEYSISWLVHIWLTQYISKFFSQRLIWAQKRSFYKSGFYWFFLIKGKSLLVEI